MGTSDKATNWLLEQRTLHRAHANEGKEIRNMIDDKVSFDFITNHYYNYRLWTPPNI